ncbi:MAG: sensor histidine kinase [Chloroflexota bacterium]
MNAALDRIQSLVMGNRPMSGRQPGHNESKAGLSFLYSSFLVLFLTLLVLPLRARIEPTNLAMFYLLAVVVAAMRLGRGAAIFASLLSVVAFDVVFVPPYYTLGVDDAQYLLTFAGLLGVSLVISALTARAREQARAAQRREAQTAALYERNRELAEEARQAQLHQETEELQAALLNSISHDLRTPLATITGALSSLRDDYALLDEGARRELLDNAYEEAERLNRLVGNLLDMTRLEAGALRISKQLAEIEDVIGAALVQLSTRLGDRPMVIDTPKGMPPAPVDFALMVQVFVNLLDNAHKYAPAGTAIEICARGGGDELLVEVADRGPGIPSEQLERVFDKFVRLQEREDAGGTGLGLSISRGIVEAHGGRLWARNREGGGAVLTVELPLETDHEPLTEDLA